MKSKQEMIASDLAQKIRCGMYEPGTLLPSENQLTELYGSSRETVRHALSTLNDLGMIQKIRGKGSMVLDPNRFAFPVSGITSFKELNDSLGMKAQTKVLACHQIKDIPEYFKQHGVNANSSITYVERLRIVDETPIVLDCDYLLSPIEGITKEIASHSLYHYIEDELGYEVSYATKEITVEEADDKIAKKMKLPLRSPIVVIRSLSYLQDTTLFELTESYHRADKFKFNDFARRHKINL